MPQVYELDSPNHEITDPDTIRVHRRVEERKGTGFRELILLFFLSFTWSFSLFVSSPAQLVSTSYTVYTFRHFPLSFSEDAFSLVAAPGSWLSTTHQSWHSTMSKGKKGTHQCQNFDPIEESRVSGDNCGDVTWFARAEFSGRILKNGGIYTKKHMNEYMRANWYVGPIVTQWCIREYTRVRIMQCCASELWVTKLLF
jgi:hypothetical protein